MEHEAFIHAVADLAVERLPEAERGACACKLVYGSGHGSRGTLRGVTIFRSWKNGVPGELPLVEVCALAEEGAVQLAGTTIHEMGHVLAGPGAGHGKVWKQACQRLGLRAARAAGMRYTLAALAPEIRERVAEMAIKDGRPLTGALPVGTLPRPCSHGTGSRGGTSRGKGSGSRLRKWVCECPKPVIVRVASDDFHAHCDACGAAFKRG